MSPTETSVSLYADWQQRRDRLLEPSTPTNPWHPVLIKILDFLLHRYRDSTIARQPVRAMPSYNLEWDDRRIVVHHHLGGGSVAGVKSRDEAQSRIQSVVRRMAAGHPDDATTFVPAEPPIPIRVPVKVILSWRAIRRAINRGLNADDEIQRALAICPQLPRDLIRHLVSRSSDTTSEDRDAVELLLNCQSRSVLPGLISAWRERVAHGLPDDMITQRLEEIYQQPQYRERVAESMRELLADDDVEVRIAAIGWIPTLGGLQDVGLLSDLLTVADSSQGNRERLALLDALSALSQRSSARISEA